MESSFVYRNCKPRVVERTLYLVRRAGLRMRIEWRDAYTCVCVFMCLYTFHDIFQRYEGATDLERTL